jgi:ankyrin repeat protein
MDYAARGKPRKVRELLRKGVDPNGTAKDGRTALHWASQEGQLAVVRELLAHGAAVDAQDKLGFTPLTIAAGEGHYHVARELLKAGASARVTARADADRTPLHAASVWDRRAIVRLLVGRSDAEINARDSEGKTALAHAIENGNKVVADFLSTHGGRT